MAALVSKHHKVVIVGAGLAGIGAAQKLFEAGIDDVLILEAQSKIGGRVLSSWQNTDDNSEEGFPLELGATWIHGIHGNPVFKLAKQHKLLTPSPRRATRKRTSRGHKVLSLSENGNPISQELVRQIFGEVQSALNEAEKLHQADDDDISGLMCVPLCIPKKQDTGLRSYVEQRVKSAWTHCSAEDVKLRNSILSHRLKWETGISGCHDMNDVSTQQFGSFEELGGPDLCFPNGFQSLCDVLTKDIPEDNLLTNSAVKRIYWNRKESVSSGTGNSSCDNQGDEQKTPLLSPTSDNDLSIAEEIDLKCINVQEASFSNDTVELSTTCDNPSDHTDPGCFRTSHSNQDLQKEVKAKDVPVKNCIVECENGQTFVAERVIVTISLGCLKESHETLFSPPLPAEKKYTINKMGIGTVDKIFFKFPDLSFLPKDVDTVQLFWDADAAFSSENWWRKINNIFVYNSPDPVWLTIWLTGHEAEFAEKISDDELCVGFVSVLKTFLKRDDVPLPIHVERSKWFENKFVRGSYSYIAVGSTVDDVDTLAQPLLYSDNTAAVMFAGEATHPSYYSTTHGALLSGFREAERILLLKKQ